MPEKDQDPAPQSNGHPRPDHMESTASAAIHGGGPPRKTRIKCLLYLILFIIFQTLIILVFVLVIMKVRTPKFRLRSATLQALNQGPAPPPANSSFAARLTAELTVRSANFGRYKYRNTTVFFFYRGKQVGQADVAKSSVGWRSTKKFEASADLDLTRAQKPDDLAADLAAGVVTVTSKGSMRGRVEILFVIKKSRSTEMDCKMEIATASRELRTVDCK